MFIKDRQAMIEFPSDQGQNRFFFKKNDLDTVKICHEGKKSYLHFADGEIEEYATKKALRRALSRESGGTWCEEKEGITRYFMEKRGWLTRTFQEVSREECLKASSETGTLQKVLGISLGLLAMLPGALESYSKLPLSGSEVAKGLALYQKSPLLGMLSLFVGHSDAQAIGTEFQVNNYTLNDQSYLSIAALQDGGFIVTWSSDDQDGSFFGIYAQRYDHEGFRVGGEFRVNNETTNQQHYSSVEGLSDGGFLIAWQSANQDGDLLGIFAQRYDVNGLRLGLEFQVNTYTTARQRFPDIASLGQEGFVIVWQSEGQDGDGEGIYGQRFHLNGTRLDTEFSVNTNTTSDQKSPEVAPLLNSGWTVVWDSNLQDGSESGIYAQRYHANGTLAGSEFRVNTYTSDIQQNPSIATLINGNFVIAWMSRGQDGNDFGIFAQLFAENGTQVGGEFQVNVFTASFQLAPSVAGLMDGGFLITWLSSGQDGSLNGVFARKYSETGVPVQSEFQVNTYTNDTQSRPAAAGLINSGFVIAWESAGQDGSGTGIFGQRYDANGMAIGPPIMTSTSQTTSSEFSTFINSSSRTSISVVNTPSISSAAPSSSSDSTEFVEEASSSSVMLSSTPPSGIGTLSLVTVVYEEVYPITINGNVIGSFYLTGGTGSYQSGNMNMIVIELSEDYVPEEGDSVLLFTDVLDEDLVLAGDFTFVRDDCIAAQGEVRDGDYYLVFDIISSCMTATEGRKLKALPLALLSY